MNYETETHYDKQVNFIYEGFEYVWYGDYTVTNCGEDESEYAPAYGETEISIDHTNSLFYYNETTDEVIDVIPTPSILIELEIEIERNL
jgi:hypothetical protein